MADLRSVTACAKILGVQRQRLSLLLDQAGVEKIKQGRESLVEYKDACSVVQNAAATGKIRTPKINPKNNSHTDSLIAKLEEDNSRLKRELSENRIEFKNEKEALIDKIESLSAFESEVKLLRASKTELEEQLAQAENAQSKSKNKLFAKIGKVIDAIKD